MIRSSREFTFSVIGLVRFILELPFHPYNYPMSSNLTWSGSWKCYNDLQPPAWYSSHSFLALFVLASDHSPLWPHGFLTQRTGLSDFLHQGTLFAFIAPTPWNFFFQIFAWLFPSSQVFIKMYLFYKRFSFATLLKIAPIIHIPPPYFKFLFTDLVFF